MQQAAPATINVGVIGFTPPTIMAWDKRWLDGNIYTTGLKETAETYIPEMRGKGADVVVAVSHGGLDNSQYDPTMENGSWWLTMADRADATQPAMMDALLIGHSHQVFPSATSTVGQFNLPGVDKVKGLVNGVPTVMANYWGKNLGVVQLTLVYDGQRWSVDSTKTVVEARSIQNPDKSYVSAEPLVATAVAAEHQATINYVKTPIGASDFRMTTYFADVGEIGAIEIVNQAQTDYMTNYIQANLPQYAGLPVLSVSAPFKSGFAGGSDYTDVDRSPSPLPSACWLSLRPRALPTSRCLRPTQAADCRSTPSTFPSRRPRMKRTARSGVLPFAMALGLALSGGVDHGCDAFQRHPSRRLDEGCGAARLRHAAWMSSPARMIAAICASVT